MKGCLDPLPNPNEAYSLLWTLNLLKNTHLYDIGAFALLHYISIKIRTSVTTDAEWESWWMARHVGLVMFKKNWIN